MALIDDSFHKRASNQQAYEDYLRYSKAPPFRRSVAAVVDLSLLGVPAIYGFLWTGSYLVAVPMVFYLLVRDCLFRGRSVGKASVGLVTVHKDTFAPCTLRQSLIRNGLYAIVCPAMLLPCALALGTGVLIAYAGLLVFALLRVRFSPLSLIGYDSDDGRTIPDSWAETYVLTPEEIATITKLRNQTLNTRARRQILLALELLP